MAKAFFDFCSVPSDVRWSAYTLSEREWDYAFLINKVPEWINWYVFQTFGLRSPELTESIIKTFSPLSANQKLERMKEFVATPTDQQLRLLRHWGATLPTTLHHAELFSFLEINNGHLRAAPWLWSQTNYSPESLLTEMSRRSPESEACRAFVLHLLRRQLYSYLADVRTEDLLADLTHHPTQDVPQSILLVLPMGKRVKKISLVLPLTLSLSEKGIQLLQLRLFGDFALRRLEWDVCAIPRLPSRDAMITMGSGADFKRLVEGTRETLSIPRNNSDFERHLASIIPPV